MAERDPILNQPPDAVPLQPANAAPQVIVVEQPAPVAQTVAAAPQPVAVAPSSVGEPADDTIILVSHSPLVYWWPVWVSGYIMAAITYWYGERLAAYNSGDVVIYPGSYLGVIFFLILFSVIVISNVNIRGYASGMVVMTMITAGVILAYFDAWRPVLGWLGHLNVYLNLGAYFWFSTLLFIVWAATVFIVDRASYMRVTPGQMTSEAMVGAASRSYDTENMVFEKHRDDLFRHWILGFGSGDLKIQTHGAHSEEIELRNVLFIGTKVNRVQELIASEPSTPVGR